MHVVILLLALACHVPAALLGEPLSPEDLACLDLCQDTPGLEETVEARLEELAGDLWCVCAAEDGSRTWLGPVEVD